MNILAIETSCDETAVSILHITESDNSVVFKVRENIILSQADKHAEFGGVFPQLAKREHTINLPILLENIFQKIDKKEIDLIAVTAGPGLAPALWVGVTIAKELAQELNIPLVPVNHMEGHIYSVFAKDTEFSIPRLDGTIISLLVSGGHTELISSPHLGTYTKIGHTLDDAAGEAFDKVARILDLPYPGGPHISKLALQGVANELVTLPRPMMYSKDLNFSFSGIKTSVLYLVQKLKEQNLFNEQIKCDIAREFQQAVADVLVKKTKEAVEQSGAQTLIVAGGVSANTFLIEKIKQDIHGVELFTPDAELTGDNSVMIAVAGYFQYKNTTLPTIEEIRADSNMSL